jgi:hypothetical protein
MENKYIERTIRRMLIRRGCEFTLIVPQDDLIHSDPRITPSAKGGIGIPIPVVLFPQPI